jgi:hypothetical protein
MLTEFDQSTLANMTAALDAVCKKIPEHKDTHALRKRIGDEIIATAHSGRRTYADFKAAGLKILKEALKPQKRGWFRWMRLPRRRD